MTNAYNIPDPVLPPGVKLDHNVPVKMRDGINIVVDIYHPAAEGKYPTVFCTAAYIKDLQVVIAEMSQSIEAGAVFYLVRHGYAVVIAQARGAGLSQGQYNWYDKEEQKDGYEIIEWIAGQPWSNGNVGMLGESYFGRIQWLIAGLQPPHLKCIVPYDASMDDYRCRHEGGFNRMGFLFTWAPDVMMQCAWPGPVPGKLPPTNIFTQVPEHPDDDEFYQERSGQTNADKIKCAVLDLVLGGSHLHSRTQLAGYDRVKSPKKLVILPFNVAFPPNAVLTRSKPLNDYILRFLDKWLKGIETGIMDEPPVIIFDRTTGEARYENEYPVARTQWQKYYFRASSGGPATKPPYGLLSLEGPGKEAPDSYGEPEAVQQVRRGNAVLAFSTEPLKEDLRLWGPISATIYGACNTTDTGWFVKVGDAAPDGKTTILVQGCLKASYREVDDSKSKPGQPYHPYKNPVLPEKDRIYRYEIEITPVFYTFKKDHRVWVEIASQNPEFMGRLNTVYTAEMLPVPGKNTVYHEEAYPSHILLPVVPDAPITKPVPPPLADFRLPMGDTQIKY